ncbi:MAG TPA: glycosyltransferase family 2 protein [Rhodopila sp.]|jgi:glycosyltransferase involved in cell wall biosynthesis|nr:glycosyltransferase family 2 protein [Rhodopila sp.]
MTAALHNAVPERRTIASPAGICGSDRDPAPSCTHLVVIPSYNSGRLLEQTVRSARSHWAPVWIVIDGSSDGSWVPVEAMTRLDPYLRVFRLSGNCGKGAAVRHGLEMAAASGFTHALVMDADGQHPPDRIAEFMAMSAACPETLVMGRPVFGPDAPWIRIAWRRLSNAAAALMVRHSVGDTLFGFRVYPIRPLLRVMRASPGMRRFDFDPEAVVRLVWDGMPLKHLPTRVRYLTAEEDGVSHFRYLRDNLLLTRMYIRLGIAAIRRAWGHSASGGSDAVRMK